jgi:Uma2 family endonuclease
MRFAIDCTSGEMETMETEFAPAEQRVLLRNVSWDTFERLLAEHLESAAPRFNFDHGVLEIMSPSSKHEEYKQALTLLVEILAEELGTDIRNLGSTTFRRSDFERGFEADVCFYVQNAGRIEGKTQIDPTVDPAPDLVIEIEITAPALNKLPIYAGFRVPEVWRYNGRDLLILQLRGAEYVTDAMSKVFPKATAADLSRLASRSVSSRRTAWFREVRDWARGLK